MKRSSDASLIRLVFKVVLIGLSVSSGLVEVQAQKLKPEEVLSKHLESIGTPEARANIENMIIGGTVVANYTAPATAQFNGQSVIASAGDKSVIGMGFENSSYSQENLGYDGQNVTVGFARPGVRSNLGEFILTYKNVLKDGLMGGTLTHAWPLLKADKKPKLEYGGLKKIGGKQAHELKYRGKGSDLEITLFFDAETFHHVRTEYVRVISAAMGANVDASGGQRSTRHKLVEEFSDYKPENGLTLPHAYKISLELDSRGGTFQATWNLALTDFSYNKELDTAMFNVAR